MDKTNNNSGSFAGIAVASLLALAFAAAFAFEANNYEQQYKDCITKSELSRYQCRLLYPA